MLFSKKNSPLACGSWRLAQAVITGFIGPDRELRAWPSRTTDVRVSVGPTEKEQNPRSAQSALETPPHSAAPFPHPRPAPPRPAPPPLPRPITERAETGGLCPRAGRGHGARLRRVRPPLHHSPRAGEQVAPQGARRAEGQHRGGQGRRAHPPHLARAQGHGQDAPVPRRRRHHQYPPLPLLFYFVSPPLVRVLAVYAVPKLAWACRDLPLDRLNS
jgi:hypothetical protein